MITKTHTPLSYPIEYRLLIATDRPRKVGIIAIDKNNEQTMYTKRWNTVKGKQEFFVKLPQSPKEVEFKIFDIRSKQKSSDGIKVLSFEPLPLSHNINAIGLENDDIVNFIEFAQEFCERASYISPGIYVSNNGKFVIKYMDVIRDNISNTEITTPARINVGTGQIQISKKIFTKYTIPGRMAIILHEFSHVYLNKKSANESEADLNAAKIYLGLGYPRVELLNVWANVFYKADNQGNRDRWAIIKNYINKFDSV